MKMEKIKPIPKYILKLIQKADKENNPKPKGWLRFYSYLTKNDGELVKVTVAVKHRYKTWYCKQVAVHGIHSEECFIKDIAFSYIAGYRVGWYEEGISKYQNWWEGYGWDTQVDKLFDPYGTVVNKDYLKKFPEYKYAAWELHKGPTILQYLRTYEQYPQVEYLMKAGLSSLQDSKLILKRIAKDKKFCKWLMSHKEELAKRYYYKDVVLRAYTSGQPLDFLQRQKELRLSRSKDTYYQGLKRMFDNKTLSRIEDYVLEKKISFSLYFDYARACTELGLDMNEEKHLLPHDFKHWHHVRTDEYATLQAAKDAEKRKALYEKFATVAAKYTTMQHNKKLAFMVVIAKSPAELTREGDALHHCVGRMGYDQKMAREESLIFFVRSKEHPDTPFVTVEYSPSKQKILQCYGCHNQKPDEEVMAYINTKWLPYANKAVEKIAA